MSQQQASREAGFTLVEVLVALAVCGALLAAMAPVFGWNIGQARGSAARLDLASVESVLLESLPERALLGPGTAIGEIGTWSWRMVVTAMPQTGEGVARWTPYLIRMQITGPEGASGRFETIRLGRKP